MDLPGVPSAAADRGPLDRLRPRLFLAAALAVFAVGGTFGASHGQPGARALDPLAVALVLVGPVVVATLVLRPVLAILVTVGALAAYLLLGYAWGPVLGAVFMVLVTVLLTGPAPRARLLAWSGAVVYWAVCTAAATLRADGPPPAVLFGGVAWSAVLLLVAGAVRERFARAAAVRAARQERERTAVATERLRIARELHDVLAHSLSAISVQAGVGLHLLDRDREQARSALASIRATSNDALDEVRAVLGILRGEAAGPDDDGRTGPGTAPGMTSRGAALADTDGGTGSGAEAARAPTWDLAALPRLAEPLRARGVAVRLDVDAGDVPPRIAGVAYRVVQEALTNVGRHAPAAHSVVVRVRRDGGTLRVTVSDDGGPARTSEAPAGYGLRGMRERVEGAGGTLAAGAGDGGFVVDAAIPVRVPGLEHAGANESVGQPVDEGPTVEEGGAR
jgi:signal transduction histidine kinase